MKKVAYIISDIDKALAFEWIAIGLRSKFNLIFILIGRKDSDFSFFLKFHSVKFYEVSQEKYSSKLAKWWAVFSILRKERPTIVHTHLWQANLIGLTAAWVLQIHKRIYTRHHATIHYHEYPSGRKWDVLCNFFATDIVAISQNISEILIDWDKADPRKIRVVYHGFDLDYFSKVSVDRVRDLKNKYNLNNGSFPIVGVISRYMEWKGVQYIIPAFKKVLKQFPTAKLILANAHGAFESQINDLLKGLPNNSYIQIIFEGDLAALYKLFDVYVHVPIDPHVEAFGQTYVESLASGVPSVFTMSGIAKEFIIHGYNACVVDFKNSDQIEKGIKEILGSPDIREKFRLNGMTSVRRFSLDNFMLALERLYKTE